MEQALKFAHRMEQHYVETGKFMQLFTLLENQVTLLAEAGVLAGTPDQRRPVKASTLDKVIDGVIAERAASGLPASPYLDRALTQLSLIRKARNRIAHSGVQFREHHAIAPNNFKNLAKPGEAEEISVPILRAMQEDLWTIMACLGTHCSEAIPNDATFDSAATELEIPPWLLRIIDDTGARPILNAMNFNAVALGRMAESWQYVPRMIPRERLALDKRGYRPIGLQRPPRRACASGRTRR